MLSKDFRCILSISGIIMVIKCRWLWIVLNLFLLIALTKHRVRVGKRKIGQ